LVKNKNFYLPLTIFCLSFFLRLTLISKGPFSVDSLDLAIYAEKTVDTLTLQKQTGLGFPLSVLLSSLAVMVSRWFSIFDPVWSVNMLSVTLSSFTVLTFYLLSREIFDDRVAILTATGFSLSPIFLGLSVYGKSQIPALFFLMLSILVLWHYLKTRRRRYFLMCALFLGCFGATRIHELVLMAIPISFLFFQGNNISSQKAKRSTIIGCFKELSLLWILTGIVTILFYIPLLIQDQQGGTVTDFSFLWKFGLLENFLGLTMRGFLFCLDQLSKNFTELGLLLGVAGLIILAIKKRWMFCFLLLWVICPFIFYGNLKTSITGRYFVLLIAPIVLLQGVVLEKLFSINKHVKRVAIIFYCGIVFSMFWNIYPNLKLRRLLCLTKQTKGNLNPNVFEG